MTTWTKTPPTEPGWFFARRAYSDGTTSEPEVIRAWFSYIEAGLRYEIADIRGHFKTYNEEQLADRYEFWPVRIEEPPSG